MEQKTFIVEFNPAFRDRTVDFCKDELDWHINNCEAVAYHDEILAEIELLYKLNETKAACDFIAQYIDRLDYEYSPDSLDIQKLGKEVVKFANNLVGSEIKMIETKKTRHYTFEDVFENVGDD